MRGGAVWSARLAHNQEAAGSNPASAPKPELQIKETNYYEERERNCNY